MTRCPREPPQRDLEPLDQDHPARELARTHREWLADELGAYLDNEYRSYADTKVRK